MLSDLKNKTFNGLLYKFAERVGAQGINLLVQILLARLLMPEEFGLIALVTVLIMLCDVFVTYGFSSSLIVNKDSDSLDFSTCFYFSLVLAIVVYSAVFLGASWIAAFYCHPLLTPIVRVMALRIPIAAVNTVQHAYVSKYMQFRLFFYATLIGTFSSGLLAVVMAYAGFGIWALVAQYLGNALLDTICLWIMVGWRPKWEFSFVRLRAIFNYGWKILAVGFIDVFYGQMRTLAIGKKYSSEDLAFYNQGYRFPSFGMQLVEPTVNAVLFPALSQCQDEQKTMKDVTRKVILVSTYLISPIMIMLIVIAEPLVLFLLTEKWLPCVAYLQIGCIANLFRPQQFINNCVIRASGDSGLLLWLDVLKKAIGLALLFISMPFGVFWIAMSLIAVYFISMVINIAPNRRILDYGYGEQFQDVFGNLATALIMGACIYPLTYLGLPPLALMVSQVLAGIAIYLVISWLVGNESVSLCIRACRLLRAKLV